MDDYDPNNSNTWENISELSGRPDLRTTPITPEAAPANVPPTPLERLYILEKKIAPIPNQLENLQETINDLMKMIKTMKQGNAAGGTTGGSRKKRRARRKRSKRRRSTRKKK